MKLSALLSSLRVPRVDQRADSPMMDGNPTIGSLRLNRKRTVSVDEMLARSSANVTASTNDSFHPQHRPSKDRRPLHHRKSSASLSTVANGMRRLLHRASASFRSSSSNFDSDPGSFPASSAPTFNFRRASFNSGRDGWSKRTTNAQHHSHHHHSSLPFLSTVVDDDSVPSRSIMTPIPGNGSEPPVVPDGNGGAAARAAAAAENERFRRLVVVTGDSKAERDNESGIGIEIQEEGQCIQNYASDIPVVRADPVVYLPSEIMAFILSHLDHRSLIHAELVSRAWRQAAASHHVWRDVFRNEHKGELPRSLSHYQSLNNSGKGLGKITPDQDWKKMFSLRTELRRRWARGSVIGCYLSGHTDSVYCVQFDDDKIITGSRDQTIRVWNIRTGDCTKLIGPPISSLGDTTASSSQSSTSASGVITIQPSPKVSSNAAPQVFADDDIAAAGTSSSEYHRASILCLQYDKEILVTGSSDNTCIVWSITEDYKPIRRLSQHTAGVLDVSFDTDRIVSCSKDTTLCVWDRTGGELLHQLRGHKGPVNAVEVRGNLAASGSGDSLVKLWNLDSAVCIREFDGHDRGLACVQFSQDAQMIVSGGNDDVICIWNANTGECIKRLSGHKHLIRALHLDSDNGRLVSASYDMSIKVYDVETGRLMLDFPGWHTSWILSAKADYRRIVSTSQDRRMLILDFGAELEDVELLEG